MAKKNRANRGFRKFRFLSKVSHGGQLCSSEMFFLAATVTVPFEKKYEKNYFNI
jgi:hypothetical protein